MPFKRIAACSTVNYRSSLRGAGLTALMLALYLFVAGSLATAQAHDYFSPPAYRDEANSIRDMQDPQEICNILSSWWGWNVNGNSTRLEEWRPGNWKCQLYYRGQIQPDYYMVVGGQCQLNEHPLTTGKPWNYPEYDPSRVQSCMCRDSKWDSSVQWCTTQPECPPGQNWNGTTCLRPTLDLAKNNEACPAGMNGSNPIHTALGTKLQSEADFDFSGVQFRRFYSSAATWRYGGFGDRWRHTFERQVQVSRWGASEPITSVWVTRENGTQVVFKKASDGAWRSDPDVVIALEAVLDANGIEKGWKVRDRNGNEEIYDHVGRFVRWNRPNGNFFDITYSSNGVKAVRDRQGRILEFFYGSSSLLTSIKLPDDSVYRYEFGPYGVTTRVRAPGEAMGKRYVYEDQADARRLTGIYSEDGTRYATWVYDSAGRAVMSVHGDASSGVDRYSFKFNPDGSTSVTDALGKERMYSFTTVHGVAKVNTLTAPCTFCGGSSQSTTYDANGFVDVKTGFDGRTTDYDYDSAGRVLQMREDITENGAAYRQTTFEWIDRSSLPSLKRVYDQANVKIAEEKRLFNSRGQVIELATIDPISMQSRVTSTTYCEQADVEAAICPLVGLTLRTDGPRTDVDDSVVYQYRTSDHPGCAAAPGTCEWRKGDLWRTTNALGQTEEVLRYDGAGRPLSVRSGSGAVTDLEYDPRGRLIARSLRSTN